MKIDELKIKWDSVPNSTSSYQRVDDEHILDLFIGKDSDNLRELMLISDFEPAKIKSSRSIEVIKRIRKDDRWAIQIKLLEKEQEEVFTHLCWDLIELSRNAKTKTSGIEIVIARFLKWQKLMEGGSDILPDEIIKGIIGELMYAKEILFGKFSWDIIFSAWLGPDGADKDFVFDDTWSEIKAIKTGRTSVGISSMEQLSSNVNGTLVLATIDNTSSVDTSGFGFSNLINEFRELLKSSPNALFDFEDKLFGLGYIDRKEYYEKYYVFYGFRFFRVDENFPKLIRETIPEKIIKVKYEIAISEIKDFEL